MSYPLKAIKDLERLHAMMRNRHSGLYLPAMAVSIREVLDWVTETQAAAKVLLDASAKFDAANADAGEGWDGPRIEGREQHDPQV